MKNAWQELGKEQKMLAGSLIAGVLAAALVFFLVHDVRMRIEKSMDPVEVVAASKYISSFAELDDTMLTTIKIPKQIFTNAHVTDIKRLAGKRTMVPFIAGEPIMINKVADKGSELNTIVPSGMRAVSIGVTKENAVSYMINPGDFVDVMMTYEAQSGDSTVSTTLTLLQTVQVIAVGGSVQAPQNKTDGYDTITLALAPQDAEVVTFALEKGRLNFVLRPVGDKLPEKVKPVTFSDVSDKGKLNATNQVFPTPVPVTTPVQAAPVQASPDTSKPAAGAGAGDDDIKRKPLE